MLQDITHIRGFPLPSRKVNDLCVYKGISQHLCQSTKQVASLSVQLVTEHPDYLCSIKVKRISSTVCNGIQNGPQAL